MKQVHIVVGIASIVVVSLAGLWGAWCWYRGRAGRSFWRLMRTGQAIVVLQAALGGVLLAEGKKEPSLHLIYGLLPIGVSFLAEQLRIASAQAVLDGRGYEAASAVGELPEEEQQTIVVQIVQRELGVMVLAALVMAVLLWRAAVTAG